MAIKRPAMTVRLLFASNHFSLQKLLLDVLRAASPSIVTAACFYPGLLVQDQFACIRRFVGCIQDSCLQSSSNTAYVRACKMQPTTNYSLLPLHCILKRLHRMQCRGGECADAFMGTLLWQLDCMGVRMHLDAYQSSASMS